MNEVCDCALPSMDQDQRAKSQKTLADNQRWLDEHPTHTFHKGDLPTGEPTIAPASPELGMRDQQQ